MASLEKIPQRLAAGTWRGFSMKHISLATLIIQNSALIIILHYSRTMPLVGGYRYLPSTAVFLNEAVKFAVSSTFALYELSRAVSPSMPATSLFGGLASAVFTGDSWKLAIPASLYVLQNSLLYFAVSNLDTAIFQVTYQFKILPTAIFSILLLQRSLSAKQWTALGLLMIGVAIVQLPATGIVSIAPFKDPNVRSYFTWLPRNLGTSASTPLYKRSATYEGIQEDDLMENPSMDPPLGFAAAVGGSTISALASVYFEKILKDSVNPTSLWVRNVQLAFYSLFPALFIGIFYVDGERVAHDGFFAGYNWVVWTTVIFQAIGGILVSFCIKHADNITKNFAISISILIGLCVSVWVFEFTVTANFFVGTCAVLLATYLYGNRGRGVKKR